MKIYKREMVERKRIKYIICNKCGKSIKINDYKDFLSITKHWGYNSSYDNEVHKFDICQDCYETFVSSLKIKPKNTKMRKFFCL